MTDTNDTALLQLLTEAQAEEAKGQWTEALQKRAAAVRHLLGGTEPVPAGRSMDNLDPLEQLGEKYTPSKRGHDYLHRYWRHLRDVREKARKVVEIGVQSDRSIRMWEEFFPNATIYGVDIDPYCANYSGGRKQVFVGDQMDEKFLLDFLQKTGGGFDVVIDDGLHTSYSMLKSFSYLYPAVESHGTYVIEDIHNKPDILNFLHWLMTCVNHIPPGFDLRDWPMLSLFPANTPWIIRNTVGVSFYRYMAVIERGFNPRDNRRLLSQEEYAARIDDRRQVVLQGVSDLEKAGKPVTKAALVEMLGRPLGVHIDRYFADTGRKDPSR